MLNRHRMPDPPQFGYNQLGQKIPGYIAPEQILIRVPNSANDAGAGFSDYPSIESKLQLTVQQLVGGFATQTMLDSDVKEILQDRADDAAAWNGGLDPGANNIPSLVAMYVKIFRAAVTPF